MTPKAPGAAASVLLRGPDYSWGQPATGLGGRASEAIGRVRGACGICVAWLIGLPRRAGRQFHTAGDAEARWWHWEVTERCGGLIHRYRDTRFAVLPDDPALRRGGLGDLERNDSVSPGCPCAGDH